jgi:Xaa-Pro aminopeptidase
MRFRICLLGLLVAVLGSTRAAAELDHQTDFPPEEFQARWEKIYAQAGDRGLVIVQGAPQVDGFIFPRQSNDFYYLCGIETPHSYFVLDLSKRQAILFLPPANERLERAEGKIISAGVPDFVKQITGASEVLSTESFTAEWLTNRMRDAGPIVYTPFAPAEGQGQSRGELQTAHRLIASDPWDGRLPRQERFLSLLRTQLRRVEIRDLTPILDELRSIKSEREIALVRRASELAGLGILQAIRSSKAGVYEYELDAAARYIFLVNGARQEGYRSITAAGTENIGHMHYFLNNKRLDDGELVLMDYAPDYRYYVSDIARMWPVSGKFNSWQREILQFILEYRNAVMSRIRPGVSVDAILKEARQAMEPVFARTKFSKPIYEQAARRLVETSGGVFSHTVGMAVHDVGSYRRGVLKPGHVFSVDPQLWVPEEGLYLRYEDVGVVTETGFENFTDFLPSELDDIEALVGKGGVVQAFPADNTTH